MPFTFSRFNSYSNDALLKNSRASGILWYFPFIIICRLLFSIQIHWIWHLIRFFRAIIKHMTLNAKCALTQLSWMTWLQTEKSLISKKRQKLFNYWYLCLFRNIGFPLDWTFAGSHQAGENFANPCQSTWTILIKPNNPPELWRRSFSYWEWAKKRA